MKQHFGMESNFISQSTLRICKIMKKILVTGGTGFLGRHLTAVLKDNGHDVTIVHSKNGDLTRPESLNQFNGTNFDEIYHLAAWTQAGDFCLYHSGEQWLINQQINTNMLAWWQKKQASAKMICMGTSCSYDPMFPLKEEYYLSGVPIESLFAYGMTKRMLYAGLLSLNKQFGMRYLHFVPSTLYGPGYHLEPGKQMHFIFDLVRKIIRGKYLSEEVVLWGDGTQKRELIHVDDFVRIMLALNEKRENDIINIGGGAEYPIREFAEKISELVGFDAQKIRYDTTRYVGAKSKCLDVTHFHELLPEYRLIGLDEGLRTIVDYCLKHKETILA